MTSVDSKVALFIGGAGNIGSSAITAFLEHGGYKTIVMISRSQERIDTAIAKIREKVGRSADKILGVVGDVSDSVAAVALKEKVVAAVGNKIDNVVSVVGFPYLNYGPLLGMTFEQFDFAFRAQFFASFGGYRMFMPLVKNSLCGSYIFVTGGGPDNYIGPGTGVMTITSSSTTALAKFALKEHGADDVSCTELSFQLGVHPDPSKVPHSGFAAISCADAGKALLVISEKLVADGKTLNILSDEDIREVIQNGNLD